ncbi:MAG: 1-(5-phosphoribosyl)-5-[(5-phosphoribosylamino)methylideneamino]imidazole-4-carboxamide isomerase [Desulfovibrionales bacterium]|nr:MAG: 1-(5-phosphoribosyl)-5-[(5-phosphoribosylamino)methylideneamino]imidazole-4-carboxamide isomerase [Desulfovibrionales bacterium]
MILFPAVDIKNGQCVRLRQGRAEDVTVFSPDPVAMARHWADLGAAWLHLVDLDGAFDGLPVNFELIKRICAEVALPVQLGGGIRDLETARRYLEAGVRRLIIGTMALEQPDAFGTLCAAFSGRIGVSLDAVDGVLKTKGWVADSGLTVDQVLPRLKEQGAAFLIYTDISRDGMHSGVNLPAMEFLVQHTDIPVIAAGGVTRLEDVQTLFPLSAHGLEGIITGRAIYEGTLDFQEALAWIAAQGPPPEAWSCPA